MLVSLLTNNVQAQSIEVATTTSNGTVSGTAITYTITASGMAREIFSPNSSSFMIWNWTNNFPEFVGVNIQTLTADFSAAVSLNRLVIGVNSIGVDATVAVSGGTASTSDFDLNDGLPSTYGGSTDRTFTPASGLIDVTGVNQSIMIGSTSSNTVTQLSITTLDNGGDGFTLFFGTVPAEAIVATSVPILSGWMLILLCLGLIVFFQG